MTIQSPAISDQHFEGAVVAEGRRLLALPGVVAVVGALVTAAISFAILVGVTPITPDETTTLALIGINTAFVLFLIGLIGREVHRIAVARRRGKAASRLHVRIVAMFSLVAVLPAILVAVIASITLDIGLDRWFEIRTKTIINSSLSIAEAYVQGERPQPSGHDAVDGERSRQCARALRSRPHRLSRIHEPAGRRTGACPRRADSPGWVVHHERRDAVGFRHARTADRGHAARQPTASRC